MPRILQITNSLSRTFTSGGVETVARTWHGALLRIGCDARIVSTFSRKDIPSELFDRNFLLYPAKRIFGFDWAAFSFRAVLKMFYELMRADIVLIHYCKDIFTNLGLLFSICLRKRILIQSHGMVDTSNSSRVAKRYIKILFSQANTILTLTSREEEHFKNLGLMNIKKIANPIDIESTEPSAKLDQIIYVGRFHHRKRPEILIQSMKKISKIHPELVLNMYGPESKYKEEMMNLVVQLNLSENVKILPSLERLFLPKKLIESKIMILPSYGEIYPMIMLEAAVYRCSMICGSDNGLYQEVKELQFVAVADSTNELSEKILSIIDDDNLRSRMENDAFSWVKENCDSQKLAEHLISLARR